MPTATKIATKIAARRADTPDRIIAAATELFLRDGYSNTNVEQVAAAAGVTKPTVYSHFGSKEGLLLSITQAHGKARADVMSSALKPSGNPRSDLLTFAELFGQCVLSDEAVCWHRLALSESVAHPEIGAAVFASGPARVIKALTTYIKDETKAGRLTCGEPELAAEQFLGLLVGVNPIRMMAGEPLPTKAKLKRRGQQAVNTFLAAFGVNAS
jgi:TetR/AcrR family transcriptional repressor of mexJK operon